MQEINSDDFETGKLAIVNKKNLQIYKILRKNRLVYIGLWVIKGFKEQFADEMRSLQADMCFCTYGVVHCFCMVQSTECVL